MTEPCEVCSCGIGVEGVENERTSFGALSLETQEVVREEILQRLDLGDEDVFINEVVVCPEATTVTFQDRS